MADDDLRLSRRALFQVGSATLAVVQGGDLVTGLTTSTPAMAQPAATVTAAQYILLRLRQHGVGTLFGIPGATCDPIFAAAVEASLPVVVTASDFEAGYAADGYARVRGLAAVAVTYGVGTMSLIATISGAFAERSPVVVINGGPSEEDLRIQREFGTYFSHSNGREQSDLVMFREVTAYAARVATVAEIPVIVDTAIRMALTKKRPVYIEIPKNLWEAKCPPPQGVLDTAEVPTGAEGRLADAIVMRLRRAMRPAVLLGIELDRYGLTNVAVQLVTRLQLPWATTLLAKSVIPETTPGFVGVYGGEHSPPSVIRAIEQADALLTLGCVFGRQYRRLVARAGNALLVAGNDKVRIGREPPQAAALPALVARLTAQTWSADPAIVARTQLHGLTFEERRQSMPKRTPVPTEANEPGLTYDDTLAAISGFLDSNFIVVTDTSLSMYPAADLNITGERGFVCNSIWQSIGYSVGAAIGVGLGQSRRPLVICGDGGFQTCAQSLSTMAAQRIPAIVVVLDNGQYGIEQWLLDSDYFGARGAALRPYLDLKRWDYAGLAKAMGFATATTVGSLGEFNTALNQAKSNTGPTLISVAIKRHNLPSGLA